MLVAHSPLFLNFPVSCQDTTPNPAGYGYDQTDAEAQGVNIPTKSTINPTRLIRLT